MNICVFVCARAQVCLRHGEGNCGTKGIEQLVTWEARDAPGQGQRRGRRPAGARGRGAAARGRRGPKTSVQSTSRRKRETRSSTESPGLSLSAATPPLTAPFLSRRTLSTGSACLCQHLYVSISMSAPPRQHLYLSTSTSASLCQHLYVSISIPYEISQRLLYQI